MLLEEKEKVSERSDNGGYSEGEEEDSDSDKRAQLTVQQEEPRAPMEPNQLQDDMIDSTSTELSRRQWLKQAAVFVGASSLAGVALIPNKPSSEPPPKEVKKAFIRLEPYPHRRKEVTSTTTGAATTSTGKNQTTSTVKPTNNVTTTTTTTSSRNATASTTSTTNTTSIAKKNATSTGTTQTTTTKPKNATTGTTTQQTKPKQATTTTTPSNKELAPVNFTKVAVENSINITLKDCDRGGCVRVDGTSFQKVKVSDKEFPWFLPKFLKPAPKVIRDIPDQEVLLAATIAGSAVEMVRTSLLYPLSTVKTRIQTRQQERQTVRRKRRKMARYQSTMTTNHSSSSSSSVLVIHSKRHHHHHSRSSNHTRHHEGSSLYKRHQKRTEKLRLGRRLRVLQLNIRRHVAEGNLYAGLVPSLLVSVPATGVYYGVRDVTKRMLVMAPGLALNDAAITLLGALVADVASLMIRTPADALAARLQAVAASGSAASVAAQKLVEAEQQGNVTTIVAKPTLQDMRISETETMAVNKETPSSSPSLERTSERTVGPSSLVNSTMEVTIARENWTETLKSSSVAETNLLDDEENEDYKNMKPILDMNTSQSVLEGLIDAVLPEDYERQLLLHLQRREVDIADLFEQACLNRRNEEAAFLTSTQQQQQRQQRRLQARTARSNQQRLVDDETGTASIQLLGATVESSRTWSAAEPQIAYSQEEGDMADDETCVADGLVESMVTSWDQPRFNLIKPKDRNYTALTVAIDKRVNGTHSEKDEKQQPRTDKAEMIEEREMGDRRDDEKRSTKKMANATTEDSDDEAVRMPEKEEKQLVKELREESVYQEDWFRQSMQRLPAIIITDLPYLLSRIALNRIIIHGTVNIGQYEVATIGIAMFCALLSTPFDVVRTRLLVENSEREDDMVSGVNQDIGFANITNFNATGDEITGFVFANATAIAPGPEPIDLANKGVLQTMICIAREGDGGIRNLYAGWLERTVYYGIGRAWLDPINIIGYIGIRDTLLLKLFD